MSEAAEETQAAAAEPEAKPVPAKADATSEPKVLRKQRVGVVVSTKMDKTIVVEFVARVPHPKFKKIIKRSKKFYAHDEKGEAAIGDKVRIEETRPLSKVKRWRLTEVLTHH